MIRVAGSGKNKSAINNTIAMAHAHCPYAFNQAIDPSAEKKAIKVSPQIKKGINTIATRAINKRIKRMRKDIFQKINLDQRLELIIHFLKLSVVNSQYSTIYIHE